MITQLNLLARCLVAALLLLFLFNGAQAQVVAGTAQTRSNAARPIDPPPEEEPPPYNYSAFSSQSVPTTMTAGTAYTVTVSMYNNGTTTWSSNALHALGSYNPMDNSTWGGGRVGMAGDVAPGQTATFTFQVTAPSTPGNYNFQWRMVQDGVEWFGAMSTNLVVNVVAAPRNDSQFLSQSVPASMIAGAQYPVSLTFANTGNTTWNPTNGKYVLLAVNPVNNETWVYSRIPLSGPVAPGQQTTVAWTTRAPATPGTYNFQWIILQEGVELIGTPSTNIGVVVSAPAPVNDAQFVSQNVPATMVPGQTYPVTVIMQNTGTTTWPAGDA
ncbi:MAG: hypothetical protein JWP59_3587 [Massilia sp.]|nr:hypothetical protein [Massilia sp.]